MAQTLVRLIYGTKTCQLRRLIIPDDDNQIHVHTTLKGESFLDISMETYESLLQTPNGLPHLYHIGKFIEKETKSTYHWTVFLDEKHVVQGALHIDLECDDVPPNYHSSHTPVLVPFHEKMHGNVIGHLHKNGKLVEP